jgi:hypothetical protein
VLCRIPPLISQSNVIYCDYALKVSNGNHLLLCGPYASFNNLVHVLQNTSKHTSPVKLRRDPNCGITNAQAEKVCYFITACCSSAQITNPEAHLLVQVEEFLLSCADLQDLILKVRHIVGRGQTFAGALQVSYIHSRELWASNRGGSLHAADTIRIT